MRRSPQFIAGVIALTLSLGATAGGAVDFAKDVQPILERRCLQCHGPEEQNGGIRYDHRDGAFAEADSGGRAIVPGKPEQSQLVRRITSTHKDDQMPPKGERLTPNEIKLLQTWIADGASWPTGPAGAPAESRASVSSSHWSFQPLASPKLPGVRDPNWARNGIDHFIQARREAAGLTAAPDAGPVAFIRRASYDLTGLPPLPEEVTAFEAEWQRDVDLAIKGLVDRLLASPRYGERWGRHWMDWVRYADTAGDNSDYPIPQAYLYRNYIIESFNADLPYDRFIIEQLAGDLLPAKDQAQRNRQVIATGYLAMARRFGSLLERYPWHLTIEDTIDNLGRTVLGLTISCARCHDHKFDPISTRDYYGLYGIFASTLYPNPGLELFKAQDGFVPLIPESEAVEKLKPFQAQTDKLRAEVDKLLAQCETKALENAAREGEASLDEQRRMTADLNKMLLRARTAGEKLADHLKKAPALPTAYAVRDAKPTSARIQIKGEPDRLGAAVPRKFLDVLGGQPLPEEAQKGSGRLQLAKWLTEANNPLTSRVIVNRVWQRHFGAGLVSSTSDFGLRGEPPTHPELLDWLAREFTKGGWSLKNLHRSLMTSRTYRLSSHDLPENLAADPSNRLHWKFTRQRLDAESIRDSLLWISGGLDLTPQTKPYPIPPVNKWTYTQHHPFKDDYPSAKRSVYLMTKRLTAKPYLQTFDGADPNVCTSSRDRSVTSLQALFFVNDTFVHEQADRLAHHLLESSSADDTARLHRAMRIILSRPPQAEETKLMLEHLAAARSQASGSAKDNDRAAWASLIRSLFRLNEFLYLD